MRRQPRRVLTGLWFVVVTTGRQHMQGELALENLFADMSWKIAADEMTLGPTMSQGSSQGQAAHDMSAADLQGCIGPDRDLRHLAVTCHAASARQRVPSRGRLPR